MEKNPLISVVVPVYGIDRYVGICIESILNQTYRNLEVVLVDDGSKDRSAEILDLYASKDARIRVIHKENGGLVSARKAGLAASTGSIISCVDGDDWIGPAFIEKLYNSMVSTGADMVCAGQTRVLFDQAVQLVNAIPAGVYEGEKLRKLWSSMLSYGSYYRPGITTYVWNKLFRREVLYEPQMAVDDRISIGEDAAVTYPALLKCRKVAVTEYTDYHYRQREDSMLKQTTGFFDELGKLKFLYEYMIRWKDQVEKKDSAEAPEKEAKYGDVAGTDSFADLRLEQQITDFVLSICIMRSGGRLPEDDYSTYDKAYFGKKVVICSAGTFGQQLVNRFRETGHCKVVGWVDDDYWEYRRCCMDVDPIEQIREIDFDFVLIASVDTDFSGRMIRRLAEFGVNRRRILTVSVPTTEPARYSLIRRFLYGSNSHA
ncbi:MAG: glycosyltransferase family 2 protein [Eubacterium sp.]|nr:glycosyltransferase family 2 protein [Eubacterium sp.]